ncbi:hypothetical protein IV203_012275 [Nitzschia inconspicua]|uniref:Uncharacterized protein n=1 Tax=Nitzschia inconspicua TaxID=303405 RepID=A0A9K3PJM4_9STRA|nr:hypothetical protein IV203_012275 [Nitzschia inconspicua]
MLQAKATKEMINQDEDKFTQNRKKTCNSFHKKSWQARTNTSLHVLQTAESQFKLKPKPNAEALEPTSEEGIVQSLYSLPFFLNDKSKYASYM